MFCVQKYAVYIKMYVPYFFPSLCTPADRVAILQSNAAQAMQDSNGETSFVFAAELKDLVQPTNEN